MKLNQNKVRYLSLILLVIYLLLIGSIPTFAHKIIFYAYVEGDHIIAEGKFSDGEAIKDSPIKVYDTEGKLLITETTDNTGTCQLEIPAKTDLKLRLEAGMGHQAEYILSKDQLSDVSLDHDHEHNGQKGASSVDDHQLRAIISQELDKKLGPLHKKLIRIENDKGAGLTEIIGGIGYIFGFMGLFYYLKGRNKSHD